MEAFLVLTLDFFLVGLITYYAIRQQALDQYIYTIATIFFLGQILVMVFFSAGLELTNIVVLLILGLMLLIGVAIVYTYSHLNLNRIFNSLDKTAYYTFIVISVLVGLAIFYGFGRRYFNAYRNEKRPTWFGFLINLLFFIPCMLYDLAEYLTEEWMKTRMPILCLVVFEIIILALYFAWPGIDWNCSQTQLLLEPVFLKNPVVISSSLPMISNHIVTNTESPESTVNNIRQEYAFTLWVYINDYSTPSDNLTPEYNPVGGGKIIFRYGNPQGGKPLITYYNRQLLFSFSTSPSPSPFAYTILMQKWNHVAVNYKNNQADVFVNGVLVHSHTNTSETQLLIYDVTDNVVVGDDKGVDGAICNIHYHKKTLSLTEINYEYNLLLLSNPPVPS